MSNRCDNILQWLQIEQWLSADGLSYPQSRDAIASKKGSRGMKFRDFSEFIMNFYKKKSNFVLFFSK